MKETELNELPLEILIREYLIKRAELHSVLLKGIVWDHVRDLWISIIRLAREIYRRTSNITRHTNSSIKFDHRNVGHQDVLL